MTSNSGPLLNRFSDRVKRLVGSPPHHALGGNVIEKTSSRYSREYSKTIILTLRMFCVVVVWARALMFVSTLLSLSPSLFCSTSASCAALHRCLVLTAMDD